MKQTLPIHRRAGLLTPGLLAAAIVAAPLLASAQDRVTVVMRNSGEAVTGTFEDLDNSTVYVRVSLHDQRRLPLGGILVMDFAGNAQNLPEAERTDARGADHLLVTRGGQRVRGRLVNIEGGEGSSKPDFPRTISFRTVDGEERRVRPSEVARLYMGNYPAPAATTPPTTLPAPVPGPGIAVAANQPWTRTGVFVNQGDLIRFTSSGQIWLSADENDTASVAGSATGRQAAGAPVPALAGALIGRIGTGAAFGIGNQTEVRAPASGELWLGVNDDHVGDNRGEFRVQVSVQPQAPRRR